MSVYWQRRAVSALLAILTVSVGLLGIITYNSGRALVDSQRAGCARGINDRAQEALSWYTAYEKLRAPAFLVTARSLNTRVDRAHSLVVDGQRPLGYGQLDCALVYPYAGPL